MQKEKTGKWTMSQRLQFAAFMVAAPRYMALGAMALGYQPMTISPLFLYLEIASWVGFAILEGYAIPYIARGIRRFPLRSFEWWQLQVYRLLLLLAIPTLGAPLYLAISQRETMVETLTTLGFVVWAFLLTGVGALVIDAVGTCESVNEPGQGGRDANYYYTNRAGGRIGAADRAAFLAGYYHEMTPADFQAVFEAEYHAPITVEEAETALLAARPGRNGKGRSVGQEKNPG